MTIRSSKENNAKTVLDICRQALLLDGRQRELFLAEQVVADSELKTQVYKLLRAIEFGREFIWVREGELGQEMRELCEHPPKD